MVKVFIIEKNDVLSEEVYDFLFGLCNEYKKNQIIRKKQRKDRERTLLGNALCMYAIETVFDIPIKSQEIGYTDSGKPYLKDYNNIHFSISHSESLIACAVSDLPVGIDVCKKRKVSDRFKSLMGAKDDIEAISDWTKKEAVIKKEGSGIYKINLNEIDVSDVNTFLYKDYYISVSGEF